MRKPHSQPSLAGLTEAEREQLADWVRQEEYAVVRDRVNQPRPEGFALRTLWAKVALLDLINSRLPADKKLTLAEFESLASREISLLSSSRNEKCKTLDAQCSMSPSVPSSSAPSPSSAVNSSSDANKSETKNQKSEITREIHDTILNTVHDIATAGGNTPTQLLTLQRLADFPARAAYRDHKIEMDLHRKHIADERLQLGKDRLQLAQKLAEKKLNAKTESPQEQGDDLGPYAENEDDVSERLRIQFNISKEEAARRAALCKAHCEEQARLAAQQSAGETSSRNADFQSFPSVAAANIPPNPVNPVNPVQNTTRSAVSSPTPNENCSMLDANKIPIPSAPSASSANSALNSPHNRSLATTNQSPLNQT